MLTNSTKPFHIFNHFLMFRAIYPFCKGNCKISFCTNYFFIPIQQSTAANRQFCVMLRLVGGIYICFHIKFVINKHWDDSILIAK